MWMLLKILKLDYDLRILFSLRAKFCVEKIVYTNLMYREYLSFTVSHCDLSTELDETILNVEFMHEH